MFDTSSSPYQPLAGTSLRPRGLFIKRWGTLLERTSFGMARVPAEVSFTEGALELLFRAGRRGWKIYLIGNEEAVYQGRLARDAWDAVEAHIQGKLRGHGIVVERSYACLVHPEGVTGHCGDSVYQLPNTGAFYHALHHDGLDLRRSWVIGDATAELVAGWRSGLRQVGVRTGEGLQDGAFEIDPDFTAADLQEAVSELLTGEGAPV